MKTPNILMLDLYKALEQPGCPICNIELLRKGVTWDFFCANMYLVCMRISN